MKADEFLFVKDQFLGALYQQRTPLVRWMEEDYLYANGVYRRVHHEWLASAVQGCIEGLGLTPRGTDIEAVVKMVRNAAFYGDSYELQPPFYLSTQTRADVIVCRNIVLQLADDGNIIAYRRHDPDLFALCQLPFDYDPWARCDRWREFLLWMVSGDAAEARLIQQFCAWPLVAHRLKMEKVLWLYGRGANGKSTALRVLRHMYGETNVSAVCLDAFNSRTKFHLQATLNKLANVVMDGELTAVRSVAALNSFISGDPMNIPRKFMRDAVVEPAAVLFVASNSEPQLHDVSDAWGRRVLPIECRQRPTQPRPSLVDELKSESAGILNWLLESLPELLQRQQFDVPQTVRDRIGTVENRVNSVRQFVAEKLERGAADECIIGKQLMAVFEAWCKENGYRYESRETVEDEMRRMLCSEYDRRWTHGHRERGWWGVRWKPDEQASATGIIRNADQGERLRELETRQAQLMQHNNEVAAAVEARVKERDDLAAKLHASQRAEAALREQLATVCMGQPVFAERAEMAETIAKQTKVIERQQRRIHTLTTKARLLTGKLDKRERRAIHPVVPVCNTTGAALHDPAEKAEIDELLKRLDGETTDDVAHDGAEGQVAETDVSGLPAGPAAGGGGPVAEREDGAADAGAGGATAGS